MNIQDYISSGIIQAYVLGLASEEERNEFERLAALHPELQQARDAFEKSLEQHAMDNGVTPPQKVKARFLEAIRDSPRTTTSSNPPNIITMENEKLPVRKSGGSARFLLAASVILLIVLGWLAFRSNQQNSDLQAANNALKQKFDSTDNLLNQLVEEQKAAKKSAINIVNMVGTQPSAKSSANVFWDSTSQSVYMVVKNMPKLPSDKQYQLWALIDGKPKDLGVFDINEEKFIIKMNNTQKADAFAISIEKKGGSPTPHMDQIQSMGKTQSQ